MRLPLITEHGANFVLSPSGGSSHLTDLEHVEEAFVMDAVPSSTFNLEHHTPVASSNKRYIVGDVYWLVWEAWASQLGRLSHFQMFRRFIRWVFSLAQNRKYKSIISLNP